MVFSPCDRGGFALLLLLWGEHDQPHFLSSAGRQGPSVVWEASSFQMWITNLGIWARKGHRKAFPTWGMPSAAHSMPSDTHEVILLELWELVSCLSEPGVTRVLLLIAEHKHYPGLWGTQSRCHWSFSEPCKLLSASPVSCWVVSLITGHLSPSFTTLIRLWGRSGNASAPYRIGPRGNIWSLFLFLFSGKLVCMNWKQPFLPRFVFLRTDAAHTHFLYL